MGYGKGFGVLMLFEGPYKLTTETTIGGSPIYCIYDKDNTEIINFKDKDLAEFIYHTLWVNFNTPMEMKN